MLQPLSAYGSRSLLQGGELPVPSSILINAFTYYSTSCGVCQALFSLKHRNPCSGFVRRAVLFQEAVDDLLLGFGLRQAEGHELDDLVAGNLADGGFMHEGGIHMVRFQRRHR